MDIDEEAFRAGAVSAKLYGYMPVPYAPDLTQNVKAGGVSGDREALCSIAAEIAGRMEPGRLYILGPGTTTRAVDGSASACPRPCSALTWCGTGR